MKLSPAPTKRQAQVLALLRGGYEAWHPLSFREMAYLLGVSSVNGVLDHLRALERKGLVVHRRGMGARLAWMPVIRGDEPSADDRTSDTESQPEPGTADHM